MVRGLHLRLSSGLPWSGTAGVRPKVAQVACRSAGCTQKQSWCTEIGLQTGGACAWYASTAGVSVQVKVKYQPRSYTEEREREYS
ncbi:unnamed protein product [Staurois parvus]|uniref:Uncharacterized protein n=1 Tax=Staurois parvus TaxID=386267 RepID=A0ABN9DD20_9NEOB|nr:unnamed protein product [Staurois parvus]